MYTGGHWEMSVRELRAELADVINAAGMHGQITFVTSRGRRVAAVVSVAVAEGATDSQAADDAATATMYAVNVQLLEDWGGTPSLTVAEIYEQYATDLLREFGHDPDRALAAAQAVAVGAADKVGYPMLWRHAALAVELCQRAAEITGRVLPGSYRPGGRPGQVRQIGPAIARLRALGQYIQSGQDADDPGTRTARIRAELEYLLNLPGLDIPPGSLDPYLDFLAEKIVAETQAPPGLGG